MLFKKLITVVLLALVWVFPASSFAEGPIIDGEFIIQPYEIPETDQGQGYRHIGATINKPKNELIIFGGLGSCFGPTCPVNDNVYTLDLKKPTSEQEWELKNSMLGVLTPWFTSTRGFIEINEKRYLACNDENMNSIYSFDPDAHTFSVLSPSTLGEEIDAGDCCAVGVSIPNSRHGNQNKEERIYILGGRRGPSPQFAAPDVRYYSVTFDTWHKVADLNVGRSHLGCASAERKGVPLIYAIGGGNSPAGEVLRSIEVYDVIQDTWTLYDDYFPKEGRQRLGAQNIDNKYIALIGGDSTCAGGGGANCESDQPLTRVDLIDIKDNNRLISSDDYLIPQLQFPRQTPGTSLRKGKGKNQKDKYSLYVIGGRTRDADGLSALTTTEVLSFDRINVENIQ